MRRGRQRRRGNSGGARLVGGALAAALLCVVPSSAAASGLVAEDHVFPAPAVDATDADSTIAPNGFAATAWVETLSGGQSQVDVAVRPPGGDWSAAQQMGATTMSIGDLHVTINSSGGAAVAWQDTMPPSTFVAAISTRRAGGTFGIPETVSNGNGPRVGIDASGNVTFLTTSSLVGANGEFVREAPAGTRWSPRARIRCRALLGVRRRLAVAPNGDAIAGFSCGSVAFALRRAGTWGTATTPFVSSNTLCPNIGISTSYVGVRVAIDSTSHPVGVVQESDTQADCMGGFFNTRKDLIFLAAPAGGVMAAGGMVAQSDTGIGFTPVPNDVSSPTVGIGGGSAVVGWRASDSNGVHSQMATRTFTGNGADPPSAVLLFGDPAANTGGGQVSVDQAGDTLLTWTDAPTSGKLVSFAAFRPSGGAFGQSLPASDGTGDATGPSGGIDDAGDGIVGWLRSQGTAHTVHAEL